MARTRTDKHILKHDWSSQVNDAYSHSEERRTPTLDIIESCTGVPTRVAGLGVNIVDCLPASSQEISLGALDATFSCSLKGLGSIASHLFNLEPRSGPEKPLSIDLGLYQMDQG